MMSYIMYNYNKSNNYSQSHDSSMSSQNSLPYRKMLTDVARKLHVDDMRTILFICKAADQLTKRDLELDDPLELFLKLEERGLLSSDNLDFLKDILEMVNRADCLALVRQYDGGFKSSAGGCREPVQVASHNGYSVGKDSTDAVQVGTYNGLSSGTLSPAYNGRGPVQQVTESTLGEDLSYAFDIVVEEIGRDWRQLARKLTLSEVEIECITNDHVRNLREQSMQSLVLWKRKLRSKATKGALVDALQRCKMMYIVDRLEGYQFR